VNRREITAKLIRAQGTPIVAPEGALEDADLERPPLLTEPYLEGHDGLPELMIDAGPSRGGTALPALFSPIDFMRGYEQGIAADDDRRLARIPPRIAGCFAGAAVRHFPYQDRDQALDWLQATVLRCRAPRHRQAARSRCTQSLMENGAVPTRR
jgi:hypothetical protein